MRLKIELDVDDLLEGMIQDGEWGAEISGSIKDEFQNSIKQSVLHEFTEKLKPRIEKNVSETLLPLMEGVIQPKVDEVINNIINDGAINFGRNDVCTFESKIKDLFSSRSGWNNPQEQMQVIAKKYAMEMKAQYNNVFASMIVNNMNEQGLLKDDFSKLLLEQNKGK